MHSRGRGIRTARLPVIPMNQDERTLTVPFSVEDEISVPYGLPTAWHAVSLPHVALRPMSHMSHLTAFHPTTFAPSCTLCGLVVTGITPKLAMASW